MPARVVGGSPIAGQFPETGAHSWPALAAFVGDLAARLQNNRIAVGTIIVLTVGQGGQVLQIYCKNTSKTNAVINTKSVKRGVFLGRINHTLNGN